MHFLSYTQPNWGWWALEVCVFYAKLYLHVVTFVVSDACLIWSSCRKCRSYISNENLSMHLHQICIFWILVLYINHCSNCFVMLIDIVMFNIIVWSKISLFHNSFLWKELGQRFYKSTVSKVLIELVEALWVRFRI